MTYRAAMRSKTGVWVNTSTWIRAWVSYSIVNFDLCISFKLLFKHRWNVIETWSWNGEGKSREFIVFKNLRLVGKIKWIRITVSIWERSRIGECSGSICWTCIPVQMSPLQNIETRLVEWKIQQAKTISTVASLLTKYFVNLSWHDRRSSMNPNCPPTHQVTEWKVRNWT